MKILHLMLACFYIDKYSYQENILPKYHKKMGHDVKIIASTMSFDEHGERCYLPNASQYTNEDNISVTRLAYKKPEKLGKLLRSYEGTYEAIKEFGPDIIFIHGVQFSDVAIVVKYVKQNPGTKVFVDNHSDFSNSAHNWISKNIQHKVLWKHYAQMINPYTAKFYGVLPARVDFLVNMYGLPREKVELLVMGVDDERADCANRPEEKKELRDLYHINDDDFLIINGGKIDQWKRQTLLLMDAVNQMDDPKVKLIVFGSVTTELKPEVMKRISDRVQYIGWVESVNSYKYFAASDLVVFPGRHSVFWEQVAGQGIPMIVKYWDGTTHVDCGGNVCFLHDDSVKSIKQAIEAAMQPEIYTIMKQRAIEAAPIFSYGDIARRCIAENNN